MNERITPYDPELAKSITKEGQRIVRELTHALEDKISMNERIKELAEQAGLHDFVLIAMGIDEELEKFAELIVKECAVIVEGAVNHREPASTYVGKIKQHFGVEE